eukprot:12058398-Prorocentrum_lima.AAC.1
MILGALLQPRTALTVVRDTMETVASRDDILKKVMMEDLAQPSLRNPLNMEDASTVVRVMSR